MKPLILVIAFLWGTLSFADTIYIEGTDANGRDVYDYVEVDDINIVNGFVEKPDNSIIFLEDNIKIDSDFFNQKSEFEEDEDFFGQEYEINLEEE